MNHSRRTFVKSTAGTMTAGTLFGLNSALNVAAASTTANRSAAKLKKAVKYEMVGIKGSVKDKFALLKELGFDGVEMPSPHDIDRGEVVAARDEVGLPIHGVVNSKHWQVRLSDPDETVRAKAVEHVKLSINDCALYGGDTVLIVPGKVADPMKENFQQVWDRSQAELKKVLPLCESRKVKIAIEVVWNDFLTTPEKLIEYVDAFNSPLVGEYFDCSNMLKYGVSSADWIRKLGKRMFKFDFKAYSHEKKWKVKIGEGDENWPEVLKALDEVGYNGWATSEVGSGDKAYLKDVAERMNKVLGLHG